MSKKILITGASSGFGKLTVETLIKAGHKVVGTVRDPEGRNKEAAAALTALGAQTVDLDVTNEESVNKGVAAAIEKLGGLDILINNAGVGVKGLQETFTVDDIQKVFDVNVFGVQRVSRAVLPHFREQQDGLLVTVSSLLGRMVLPFYGPYNATKWAVEAFAENYRYELSGFGVDSVVVEPGGFPTEFFGNLITPSDNSRDASYGDLINAPDQMGEDFGKALEANPAQNPQLVADAIKTVIDTPKGQRPFRTTVDKMGMGDPLEQLNKASDEITKAIYSNFGIDGMMTTKS